MWSLAGDSYAQLNLGITEVEVVTDLILQGEGNVLITSLCWSGDSTWVWNLILIDNLKNNLLFEEIKGNTILTNT